MLCNGTLYINKRNTELFKRTQEYYLLPQLILKNAISVTVNGKQEEECITQKFTCKTVFMTVQMLFFALYIFI